MVKAMVQELDLQRHYLEGEQIETIYFGGGTPSLLSSLELDVLMAAIRDRFDVVKDVEITLEANPDDLSKEKLAALRGSGVNRLSIGIQTFHNTLLTSLNRAHSATDAIRSISNAREAGFENISMDLIYALPGETLEMWRDDIEKALALAPEHISCYSLTIEPKTAFGKWTKQGKLQAPDDEVAAQHLEMLVEALELAGYEHYEVSNFAKPGFYSRHNSSYWKGAYYLGIGPSAHSYNGPSRHYTVSNNHHYLKAIASGVVPLEKEILSRADKINEYLLTTLRTSWGCDCETLLTATGYNLLDEQKEYLQQLVDGEYASMDGKKIILTKKGKLLADKIASDLFVLA